MIKWLRESLRVGTATVSYPFAPLVLTPDMRGKPEHDALACIACGACATACPPNALQMKLDLAGAAYVWRIDYGRCIFCGRCEEVCPVRAIALTQEFELAVAAKEDLVETARYCLAHCSVCNEPFAPRKELAYLAELLSKTKGADDKSADEMLEVLKVCPQCRRRSESVHMKLIVEQIKKGA